MAVILDLVANPIPVQFSTAPSTMCTGKFQFSFASSTASTAMTYSFNYLFTFNAENGHGICLAKTGATCKLEMYSSSFGTMVSQTITFSASQSVTVVVDFPNSQITISGATTGNGTFSISGASGWSTSLRMSAGGDTDLFENFAGTMSNVTDFSASTVAMTGTGTLSATLKAQADFTAAPAGTGTLSATLKAAAAFTAAPAGTGTLSATLRATANLAAALTGTGTLTASFGPGSAMAGTGTLTAAGSSIANASMAASGTGTLSAAASAIASFTASLSGAGALSATLRAAAALTAALSGTGTLSGALASMVGGASAMSGTGTLTAAGQGLLILTIPSSGSMVPPFTRTADPQRTVLIADTAATPDNGQLVGIPGLSSPEFFG